MKIIKIKSVIRRTINESTFWPSNIAVYFPEKGCSDNKFEVNKDYLFLNVNVFGEDINPYMECENILPDTPENREILIKKYEKTIIIKEPKPDGVKKK
jgi:hypothetical protein